MQSQGSRFWLLEADITDPAVDIPEQSSSPDAIYPELPQALHSETGTLLANREETHGSPHVDDLAASASPFVLSTPATPSETAYVKIPGYNSIGGPAAGHHRGYSNDVNIPSPLLYHDLQYEFMPPVHHEHPGWEIPYFEYAYGQARPEPDFTSYRSTDAIVQAGPTMPDRHDSLGFTLYPAASSKHRAEASHISDGSHDSSSHGGCPLSSSPPDCSDQRVLTASFLYSPSLIDLLGDDQLNIPLDPEWSWAEDILKHRVLQHSKIERPYQFPGVDETLIYPTLPTPAYIRHALTDNCTINSVVQPWANQAASAWEKSASGVQPLTGPVDRTFMPTQIARETYGLSPSLTGHIGGIADINFTDYISSNAHVTDLVLARLHQHQFVTWPEVPPASAPVTALATISDAEPRSDGSENVLKLVDWLVQLNPPTASAGDGQHKSESFAAEPTEEAVHQYCEDDLYTAGSESHPSRGASRRIAGHPEDEAMYHSQCGVDVAAASDHDSEIELLNWSGTEESGNENDWAYWDWSTEVDGAEELDPQAEDV